MANTTIDEILTSVSRRRPDIDLGTEINTSAEVYSNTLPYNKNRKEKGNTFQHSNANVGSAAPPPLASPGASHPGVNSQENIVSERYYGRKAKPSDFFVEIRASLGKPKVGNRHTRCPIFFSLKTDKDKKFNIFLRSALTTATNETMRTILSEKNLPLRDILNEFVEMGVENLMTGRIKYKATNGYITEQHRPCHKHGLCAVYELSGIKYCTLYFNGEYYQFELSDDYMTKEQMKYYTLEGTWERDFGEDE